tara:strand:- start:166 stop:621 length:456 start_codon:yes stop_codon:yes gene_type:complete
MVIFYVFPLSVSFLLFVGLFFFSKFSVALPKMPKKVRNAPRGTRSNYSFGVRKERYVVRKYRAKGYKVQQSKGSRGAADLKATHTSGKKHNIQVKASRLTASGKASISKTEMSRLKKSAKATKGGAVPVVAKFKGSKMTLTSAVSGRTIKL